MNVQEQIKEYITSQPEPKRSDMQALHRIILEVLNIQKPVQWVCLKVRKQCIYTQQAVYIRKVQQLR
ncbi:MAG: hypothetical protein JWM44_859 [Bacilli bacterium]|nr:hypothetical protein [Bacilli bacterium]